MMPDRASDSGPESKDPGYNWRDHLDFAAECITDVASRAEQLTDAKTAENRNSERIHQINNAIKNLERAKELLCR